MSSTTDFRDLNPKQLDKFIAENLQPDQAFHDLVGSALDNLCRALQQQMRPKVKELVKGGSMGKGTALKDKSDLDCILIIENIFDVQTLRRNLDGILEKIKTYLLQNPLNGWTINNVKVTTFMVQFDMTRQRKTVHVDLLPTFDANIYNESKRESLYRDMTASSEEDRQFYSAALAKLQRDFVKEKPAKLKDLIRLVKHWRKCYLQPRGNEYMPNSYLIELVTIHVWEKDGSPTLFDTARLFKSVMYAFINHTQLDVAWNRYNNPNRRKPRVMDPANPCNNVYDVVTRWDRVKEVAAAKTPTKPLTHTPKNDRFF